MDQPYALRKPTRLEQAQSRLDLAFVALEHAVAKAPAIGVVENSTQLTSELERENAALERENAALEKRNKTLNDLNARIVTRLDGVIARLQAVVDT